MLIRLVRFTKFPVIKSIVKKAYQHHVAHGRRNRSDDDPEELIKTIKHSDYGVPYWNEQNKPQWSVPAKYDLSVIIPFYNSERYATECIESVLNQQSDYSVELILVDDGSPDRCGEILDSYKDRDGINVIHQSNQGVSAARNNGICAAQGKYLMFVDSDDYLCDNAIKSLMDTAIQYEADIVDGAFYSVSRTGIKRRTYSHEFKVTQKGEGMYGYVFGKVIKRHLFNDICLPVGISWAEDVVMSMLVFPLAHKTVNVPTPVLNYRVNDSGLTRSSNKSRKRLEKLFVIEEIIKTYLHFGWDYDSLKRALLWQLGPSLYWNLHGNKEEILKAAFYTAARLVREYCQIDDFHSDYFYENEIYQAFINDQYEKWKWASVLF